MAQAFGTGVVENAIGNVVGNLFNRFLNVIFNPITVLYRCNDNTRTLKEKLERLEHTRVSVQHDVDDATKKAEKIEEEVNNWMSRADEYISGGAKKQWDELEEESKKRYFMRLCPNPKSLYRLSRKAEEYTKAVDQILQEAVCQFNRISYFPVQKEKVATDDKGFEDFDSRRDVLKDIKEALQSPSINLIGVHGMPGVGKTMLVEEVKRKAKQEKLFDEVIMAKVTKNPNLKRIQQEIQRGLGLELPDGITTWGASDRIKAKLTGKKKILLILDDIWEPGIDLKDIEAFGIPFEKKKKQSGHKENEETSSKEERNECKILFTSRDQTVLSTHEFGTQKIFKIDQLRDEEAHELFKKLVGNDFESSDLQQVAIEIVRECGGLPIAIATVGKALRGRSSCEWRDALQKLRTPSPKNFKGIYAKVYCAIEFSYSYLEEDELKRTFLLCSLLGHNASVEDLLKCGMGLHLFNSINTIEAARDRVPTLLSKLKGCSLLLDGRSSMHFDVHDLIQDVAMSIASREHGVLVVRDEAALEEALEMEATAELRWIYITCANISQLLDELKCPELTFFHLSNKDFSLSISADFFAGMEKLRVLSLTKVHFSSMPSSISFLTNLRTLRLDDSVFRDGQFSTVIGKLKNLQILSLAGCGIEQLPNEVGGLTKLKLLDLNDCAKLKAIPQDVLASLSRLEELKMGNSFDQWDIKYGNQRNASLAELKQLPHLMALEVRIHDVQMIPGDLFTKKLKRYKILIGGMWKNWASSFDRSRILKLALNAGLDYSVKMLLKTTEELHLEKLNGMKNVVDELDNEGFQYLKYLYVQDAPEVQQVVSAGELGLSNAFPALEVLCLHNLINLDKLFQGKFKDTAVSKLRMVKVECCHQLKNLFPVHMLRQLLQLQEITIIDCDNIKEIIHGVKKQWNRGDIVEETAAIMPGKLRSLRLQRLPKLISFGSNCRGISLFNDQLLFPNLEELRLSCINVGMIWIASYCVENLRKLIIHGCHNLKYLFSSTMARSLVKLGHLEIRACKMMREVLSKENEEEKENLIFPKLKFLQLVQLQNLVGFYLGDSIIEFSSLKHLVVWNCPGFKGFTAMSTSTNVAASIQPLFNEQVAFTSLEKMTVSHLENLTTIWHDQLYANSFCKLKSLEVTCCEKLMNILPSNNMLASFWTSLEELRICDCGALEVVFELGEINGNQRSFVIDSQLKVLDIQRLPRLKHVWSKDPEGILTFHNLESVRVSWCRSLDHLFPASVGKDLLQLQTLNIAYSGLEEIVAMGGGTEATIKFEFPQVSSLRLYSLPKLKYFYPGKHSIEWPMLKNFNFFDCCQMKKTNGQGQLDFPVQQPLFSMEKIIPQLEELSLTKDDIIMICGESKFKKNLFFNVKVLQIQGYRDESTVLPICFLHRFSNLEELVLKACSFTELFPSKGEQVGEQEKRVGTEILSRIKILRLDSLYDLKHILSQDSSSLLLNLQTLEVRDCHSLPCLSTSKTASFHNLTTLNVVRCESAMIKLISVPMARSLVHLEHMTIEECDNLTEIVGCEVDGTEDLVISFNKLKLLKLKCLPSLESFCLGDFTFKFSSLEKVIVNQCPKLNIFTRGDLNTPLLHRVELAEGEDEWRWVGDLNTTVQSMHAEKVGYAGLEDLILSDFLELIEIWHVGGKPQEILDFRQLKCLRLYNCGKLTYLLTASMVFCLVQLTFIGVKNCTMMQQVIMGDGGESKMIVPLLWHVKLESCSNLISFYVGSHSLELPCLNRIFIVDCPKMVTFAASTSSREHEKETSHPRQYLFNSEIEIPVLEKLTLSSFNIQKIWHCQLTSVSSFAQNLKELFVNDFGNLRYLFTSSMVKALTHLKELVICRCKVMDVVILMEGLEDEERMCQMLFPKLETLMLFDLPQLKRFCSNVDSQLGEISEPQGLNASGSELVQVSQPALGHKKATKLVFSEVKYLKLECLQKFKSFFSQTHIIEWPSLKTMYVNACDEVQIFASAFPYIDIIGRNNRLESWTQHPLFWISKDTFPSLEELKFEWNGNMKEIWYAQHLVHFNNLQTLEVSKCHGLANLVTYSTAKSLVQLTTMKVTECEIMEEIVGCLGDDVKDDITFTKLKYLQLEGLPRLASFCSGVCNLEFPALEVVIVRECPNMQIFSIRELSTPKLAKLKEYYGDEGRWEENLNRTVQQVFKEKNA